MLEVFKALKIVEKLEIVKEPEIVRTSDIFEESEIVKLETDEEPLEIAKKLAVVE